MRAPDSGPFGHPRGLIVLAGTELWDRISFSGMQAILVLYMVEDLFVGGKAARIWGFAAFTHAIATITGPLTSQGLATQIFGLYVGLTYLTPLFGGVIGDRWFGRRRSVVTGALLMTAGHFCMAFEASFILALALIALGAGLLRGNLTPQVAELYAPDDSRRAAAFQIYASMVAIGAFVSPLATGWLSQAYGWHIAFGFAGFGMLVGLLWYLLGQAALPPGQTQNVRKTSAPISPEGWRAVAVLLAIIPVCTLFWIAQAQVWNTYNLWVRDHVDLAVAGWTMPVPWLQALDGLSPLLAMPFLLWWWRRCEARGHGQDELTRMAFGCLYFAGAVLLLAMGGFVTDALGKVPLMVPIAFHLVSNVGWLYFSPSANSLFTGAAPAAARGTMIGAYTLSMFLGSVLSGRLGALYETWSAAAFWLLHAGLIGAAAIIFAIVAPYARRVIQSSANHSARTQPIDAISEQAA